MRNWSTRKKNEWSRKTTWRPQYFFLGKLSFLLRVWPSYFYIVKISLCLKKRGNNSYSQWQLFLLPFICKTECWYAYIDLRVFFNVKVLLFHKILNLENTGLRIKSLFSGPWNLTALRKIITIKVLTLGGYYRSSSALQNTYYVVDLMSICCSEWHKGITSVWLAFGMYVCRRVCTHVHVVGACVWLATAASCCSPLRLFCYI